MNRSLPLLLIFSTFGTALQAQNYYLQSNVPAGSGWNTLGVWFNQPSGGGSNPSSMSGNTFQINGFVLRSATANFGGASLNNSVAGGATLVQDSGRTIGQFNVSAQGSIALNTGGANYTLNVTNLNDAATLNLRAPNTNGVFTLNVANLSGAGNLVIGGGSGGSSPNSTSTVSLSVTNASAFTGNISPSIGKLTFNNSADFSLADLTLNGASTFTINLANDVTFSSVFGTNFGNGFSSLGEGEYFASDLNTLTGTSIFSGAGSITVVPEPEPRVLFLISTAALLVLWRRRNSSSF